MSLLNVLQSHLNRNLKVTLVLLKN